MEINIGSLYVNKTWRFLVPSLQAHGHIFIKKFNPVFKLAIGIHDTYLDGADIANGRNVYAMLDTLYNKKLYGEFADYIQYQPFYKGDYCPDGDVLKSRKHVFILEVPEEYHKSYDNFLQGKYSEMYSKKDIERLYKNLDVSKNVKILLKKDETTFQDFKILVENEFNVVTNPNELIKGEWELPLKKTEEIFNCSNKDTVYFNEEIDKVWQ